MPCPEKFAEACIVYDERYRYDVAAHEGLVLGARLGPERQKRWRCNTSSQ